jgi:hypothetical protein
MNNFSGNANYVEFRNFGDWAGFKLATNSAVNMAARFVKNVSVNVINSLGVGITDAIVYRLDTNNGNRTFYSTDEHFIQTTVSGVATGRILALVGRLPAGAATNSTQYTAVMDCRNAANDQTGNDILRYVSYDHLLNNRPVNLKGINTLTSEQTLFNDPNVTLNRTNAIAKLASSFTVDPVTKTVTVTANSSFDDVYDALKAYKATANAVNLATPTLDSLIVTPNGTSLEAFTGWSLVVNTGVILSSGIKFDKVEFNTITLTGTAQITGIYQDSTGTSTVLQISGFDAGSAVYVEDNNAVQKFYSASASGTVTVYIPPTGTGSWYYAVEKYGIQRQSDFFTFSGGLKSIVVKAIPDTGITVSNSATVAAYTELNTPDKIYDYVAYLRLSVPHISYGQITFKNGTSLDLVDASMLVNQSATAVASFDYDNKLLTIKSTSLSTGVTYNKIITTPPETIEANSTEVITIEIEDANGDSSINIQGGSGSFSIFKFPIATTPYPSAGVDERISPANLVTSNAGNGKYRFIADPLYNYMVLDNSQGNKSNIPKENIDYTWKVLTQGAYTAGLFQGEDQIELAQVNEVYEILSKVEILLVDTDAIKGTGFTKDTHSLINIKQAVDALDNYDDSVTQTKLDSIQDTVDNISVDFTPVLNAVDALPTLTEIEASTVLAMKSDVTALGSPLQADNYVAPDNTKIGQIKSKVDTLNNYDDAITQSKLDSIQNTVDNISIDFTPVLDAVDALPTLEEIEAGKVGDIKDKTDELNTDRLKIVSTVETTGDQLAAFQS